MKRIGILLLLVFILTLAALSAGALPAAASSQDSPQLQETEIPGPAIGTVRGGVINGTSPDTLLENLEVTLHAFTEEGRQLSENTKTDSARLFTFTEIELDPDLIFLVSATYGGVLYSSLPAQADTGETELTIQLIVYESTTNMDSLVLSRMHLAFDFLEEGAIRVGELWILNNASNLTINAPGGLEISLPEGYSNLEVDPEIEAAITVTATGFIVDQPFLPGEDAGSLMFSYSLPYRRYLQFTRSLPIPMMGATLMLPDNGLSLQGSQIIPEGTVSVAQTIVQTYSFPAMQAGDTLSLEITGFPPGTSLLRVSNQESLIGGALLLVFSAGIFWYSRRSSRPAFSETTSYNEMIRQIAALDEQYSSGDLQQEEYWKRRSHLKSLAWKTSPGEGKEEHDQG
jgi:hypothetical protein